MTMELFHASEGHQLMDQWEKHLRMEGVKTQI